ncbi:MAG: NPCBM/NEW2 domain-containing protein [Clostridia bacterium]|nr:NPCBM/NEW2 domain-containing protein [Clostridia bacterium]
MYCQNCGNVLEENDKFCDLCGHSVKKESTGDNSKKETPVYSQAPINNGSIPSTEKKGRGKKVAVLLAVISIAVVVIAAIIAVLYFSSTEYQIKTNINYGNIEYAAQLYNEKSSSEKIDTENVEETVFEKLEKIKKDFTENNIDYTSAKTQSEAIQRFSSQNIEAKAQEALQYIEDLNTSRISFSSAQKYAENKNYKDAIDRYKNVIEADENYEAAQEEIIKLIKLYKEDILENAETLEKEGEVLEAIELLEEASKIAGNDEDIANKKEALKSKHYKSIEEDLDKIIKEEKYSEGLEYFEEKNLKTGMSDGIDKRLDEIQKGAVKEVISKANSLVKEKKYSEAIVLINEFLEYKKSLNLTAYDDELKDKISDIENRKPTKLTDMHLIDSNGVEYSEGAFVDSFGNVYDGHLHYDWVGNNEKYSIYNIKEEYSTFTGSISACQHTGSDEQMVILIYVDNELRYTSKQFGKTTEKFDFSVNVKGGKQLKIEAKLTSGYCGYACCSIVNTELYK